ELDVSKNVKLTKLYVTDNKLTKLDVSHNPKLRALWATENPLEGLDITSNSSLSDYEVDEGVLVQE
ncbi:hypothetical protein CGI84_23375, partial [Vibrio parahaemolyticus]